MAKVTVMRGHLATTKWKWAFAEKLIRLCPEINPDTAYEFADYEVNRSCDVMPAVAAEQFAARMTAPQRTPEPSFPAAPLNAATRS